MQYRKFGNSGNSISALGFGCMRFPEYEKDGKWFVDEEKSAAMLIKAYESGVNYFDTAPYYCHGNSEKAIGNALKGIRDKVLISTKVPIGDCKSTDDFSRFLENSLNALQTDHIDYYHYWGINADTFDRIMNEGFIEAAQKAKEEGLIRNISFSFHDKPEAIKYIIDNAEMRGLNFASMLCQYNLLDRANEEMISYAASKGLGVVAMGPVAGGRLAAPTDLYRKLTGKEPIATYELAFRFVLSHPDISCALSGMQDIDMVEKNITIGENSSEFSAEEWKQMGEAMESLKKFNDLYCTGCQYCKPCPADIDIPRIFKAYTYHNVYGLDSAAKRDFDEYRFFGGKTVKDCKNCGACEKRCPQELKIREELKRVEPIIDALKKE